MEQVELAARKEDGGDWNPMSSVSTYAIELEHVRKVYTGPTSREVFADVNLQIATGEFVAVFGPIGSGKTTLVNMIAGIDRPTSGSIRIQGVETTRLSEDEVTGLRASGIGMVPQVQNLLDDLTVSENVEIPLFFLKLDKRSKTSRVVEVLERLGMTSDAKRKVGALSVGERQVVTIARALVSDPSILVMDEPTESLDPLMSDVILELLRGDNLTRRRTIFITTHDKKITKLASRIVRIKKRMS
jgi:putative ABC transport system ATP-binding protein